MFKKPTAFRGCRIYSEKRIQYSRIIELYPPTLDWYVCDFVNGNAFLGVQDMRQAEISVVVRALRPLFLLRRRFLGCSRPSAGLLK